MSLNRNSDGEEIFAKKKKNDTLLVTLICVLVMN